jgi:hypothetical protein
LIKYENISLQIAGYCTFTLQFPVISDVTQEADSKPQLEIFDQEFGKLYAEEGRPGTPIRLMVGLTCLGACVSAFGRRGGSALSGESVLPVFLRGRVFPA